MKWFHSYLRGHGKLVAWFLLAALGVAGLLLYKLGSLTGGLSAGELVTAAAPVGWHGIYHQPLDLPVKLVRSVVFFLSPAHGQFLSRLPNAFFGGLAIISFTWLIRLWHGSRTAVLAGVLFAASAWVLHASRLTSSDVLYLWATPTLLLVHMLLQKHSKQPIVWYGSLLVWGLILYIPGLIWLVALEVYLQKGVLRNSWRNFKSFAQKAIYIFAGLIWLPLLIIDLIRPDNFVNWLGFPAHLASPLHLLKQFVAVPVHLFIRGPQYPDIWLARTPILDIFALVTCVLGIYFYATHGRATRSHLIGLFAGIGLILVGLGGPVGLSLLVPLLYILAAAGIAYLLREWLHVFPANPLARGLGLGLIILVVSLSCIYNLRAYFVAWPHNETTRATFQYHR